MFVVNQQSPHKKIHGWLVYLIETRHLNEVMKRPNWSWMAAYLTACHGVRSPYTIRSLHLALLNEMIGWIMRVAYWTSTQVSKRKKKQQMTWQQHVTECVWPRGGSICQGRLSACQITTSTGVEERVTEVGIHRAQTCWMALEKIWNLKYYIKQCLSILNPKTARPKNRYRLARTSIPVRKSNMLGCNSKFEAHSESACFQGSEFCIMPLTTSRMQCIGEKTAWQARDNHHARPNFFSLELVYTQKPECFVF